MHRKYGFSLVELSIVLVILGLLTGGILGGQALMRAAELRSVTTEYQQYTTAIQTFRDKYFAFPGDMPNATVFWGGPPADCMNDPTTDGTTCNGDGDGVIDYYTSGGGGGTADTFYESLRAWQHLANAGLVNGTYDGADAIAGGSVSYVIGQNVPASKLSRGMWTVWWLDGGHTWTPNRTGHFLTMGTPTSASKWHDPILSTEEAWNIDTKMDDGKPYQGQIQDMRNDGGTIYTPTCNTDETTTAEYNLQTTGPACMMFIGF